MMSSTVLLETCNWNYTEMHGQQNIQKHVLNIQYSRIKLFYEYNSLKINIICCSMYCLFCVVLSIVCV
jgi:hypothetical protein